MQPGGDSKESGGFKRAIKALGSLLMSLLYVIFLPFIGLAMLVGLIFRKVVPSGSPEPSTHLGEVYQDGGEPYDESRKKEKREEEKGKQEKKEPAPEQKKEDGSKKE